MAGIMDTFKGLVDGEQRLKNLSEYDEYVDRMLSQGAATLTGQTPGEYYKNPKTIRQFNRQKSMREKPALADRLSKDKFDTGLKSFINPILNNIFFIYLSTNVYYVSIAFSNIFGNRCYISSS